MNSTETSQARGLKLPSAPPQWAFFALFTISGFSGLIYESIWSHYLKLFLGHAAYAQSLVLMIFMGGMAIGSWIAARLSPKWRYPIIIYAVVEGIIGVAALLFHNVFVGVSDSFYFSILPAISNASLGSLLKWSAAATLILPQSVLLGMTFPLMSAGIIRRYPSHPGGSLAMLYFTNSIGAAVGVLVSGFWLIRVVGLPGTILTAGLLNLALALTVWILVKVDPEPAAEPRAAAAPPTATESAAPDNLAPLFFLAAGITGAASFIYEIGWLRMLGLVLGSTTHSFELMLSAFITGLAFGGLWIKRRIDSIDDPVRFSGWVQVLMGCAAVLTVPLFLLTFDLMAAALAALDQTDQGYTLFTLISHGIALLVMVPTTFLAGMTLPLFTHVLMRGQEGERAIGHIYAANTFGAITGVLFAVHVGLPNFGLKGLIGLGAALDIFLGLALLHRSWQNSPTRRRISPAFPALVIGSAALLAVLVGVAMDPKRLASGVYRYGSPTWDPGATSVYYRDGKTATISLMANAGQLTIATNGKPDASIQMDPRRPTSTDEITMIMAGTLPLAYVPAGTVIANIGLGSGLTTHTVLADPSVTRVDTIEIETSMVEAAHGFGERVTRTFLDPRSHIHIEDAKTYFSVENAKYDAIISEPSNPWVSGVSSLFSDEFYRTVGTYLNEDGVFVQWLQLYEFNDSLALSVLKALSRNFSDYVIYNADNLDTLIVAKPRGQLAEPNFQRVLSGTFVDELAKVGLRSVDDFVVRRSATKTMIDALLADSTVPVNSDYFPFLDLNAGRARYKEERSELVLAWGISPLPILEMLGAGTPDFARVTPDRLFQRTGLIGTARAIHAAVSDSGATRDRLPAALEQSLTALRYQQLSCEAGHAEETRLEAVHALAMAVLAFVDSRTGAELLAAIEAGHCANAPAERQDAWSALYRAVAARDAAEMAAQASAILADDVAEDAPRRQYLLAAAMLGYVAQQQPARALEFWRQHGGADGSRAPPPDLQLLVGLARTRAASMSDAVNGKQ